MEACYGIFWFVWQAWGGASEPYVCLRLLAWWWKQSEQHSPYFFWAHLGLVNKYSSAKSMGGSARPAQIGLNTSRRRPDTYCFVFSRLRTRIRSHYLIEIATRMTMVCGPLIRNRWSSHQKPDLSWDSSVFVLGAAVNKACIGASPKRNVTFPLSAGVFIDGFWKTVGYKQMFPYNIH